MKRKICFVVLSALMLASMQFVAGCDDDECSICPPTQFIPLFVFSVSPDGGATGVALDATISVTFSEGIDTTSITDTSIVVTGVAGTISVNGPMVTFTPDDSLAFGTMYWVTVSTEIRNSGGVSLPVAYKFYFTTASDPLAGNPSGRLYVPNQADKTLYVFDSRTYERVDSIDVPIDEPHFVTFSHDYQYFYVVGRQQGGDLAKYQTSDNSLVGTIDLATVADAGVFPTTVMVSGSNDTLFMTNFAIDKGRTYRFDISGTNFTFLDSILQAGHQTHDMRISPDYRYLVSAGYNSDDITIYNTLTGDVQPLTVDSAVPVFNTSPSNTYGAYGVQIDKTSSFVFLACRKGVDQIRIVDLKHQTIIDSIVVTDADIGVNDGSEGPTYMTLLPDNNTLFVTGMNSNRSWAVRLSSREVLTTFDFATPRPFGITSSSDGSRVYISCTNNRPEKGMVYAIDPVTLEKVDSVQAGSEPFGLEWRPLIAGEN